MSTACDEFFAALMTGEPLPSEQLAHAVVCEDCRALLGESNTEGGPTLAPRATMGAVFREELRGEVLQELAARPFAWRWWMSAVGFAVLNLMVLAFASGALGLDNWRLGVGLHARMGLGGFILFGSATVATFAALMPRGRRLRVGLGFLCGLIPLAVLASADGQAVFTSVRQAMPCAVVETLLSLPLLAAGVFLLTRAATTTLRTWLAASGAAAVGLFALSLHCIDGSVSHLTLFHVLPWAVWVAVAMGVRWRLPTRSFVP